jgi:hypothetical protein
MDNENSKKRFFPRRRLKAKLSQKPSTARTREWERSLIGIDSVLYKIDRNRRIAISRERKRMQTNALWASLSSSEKERREAAMIARIKAKYNKEKADLIAQQES